MYNGIGLQTPRGSGTNGYVQRNISAIRKTKEKVPDYQVKEDSAVRPFDPELVEHERRRQAEVRCMELRDLLEEQELSESEIEEKVNSFRAKLLAEKKLSYQRDSSGRPLVKDSHEFSVAQEQKNERAKDAFGISRDFIPGSSLEGKAGAEMSEEGTTAIEVAATKTVTPPASSTSKSSERSKKRKKSHKRSKRSSSSNSGSSSDDEVRHKKRKKEKKKKSKKSHRHRRHSDRSKKRRSKITEQKISKDETGKSHSPRKSSPDKDKAHSNPATTSPSHISIASSRSPSPKILAESPVKAISDHDVDNSEIEEAINPRYSLSILDFSGNHKFYPSLPNTNGVKNSHQRDSPVEVLKSTCIHLLTNLSTSKSTSSSPIVDTNGNHQSNHKYCSQYRSSRSNSSGSKYSSRSRSLRRSLSPSDKSRSPSGSEGSQHHRHHRRSSSSRSRSSRNSRSISPHSHRSRSFSKSRSRSRSRSSSISRYSRSHSSSRSSSKSRSRSRSFSSRSRSGSRKSESASPKSDRSRSPSIPRRRGSPSFMERRRITSARKRPIPYKRKDGVEWQVSSGSSSDSDDD